MIAKFTLACVLLCWRGQTVSSDEQTTSQCSIDERQDTMLSTIEPPARYLGHKAAVRSPQECYDACCNWDRGTGDQCNAALFYPTIGNSQGDADCLLLLCEPFDKCIWTSAQIANTNGSSVARIWRSNIVLAGDQQPGAEQLPPAPTVANPDVAVQPSSADVQAEGAPAVDAAANNGLPESSNTQAPIVEEIPAEGAAEEDNGKYGKEYTDDEYYYYLYEESPSPQQPGGVAEMGGQAPVIQGGWNGNGNPFPDAGNGQPASDGQQPSAERPLAPQTPFWMLYDSYTSTAGQPPVNENPDANSNNDTQGIPVDGASTVIPVPVVVSENAVGQGVVNDVNSSQSTPSLAVQGQAVFIGDGNVDRDAAQLAAAAAQQTAEEDRDFAEQHVDVQVPIFIDGAPASETDKVPDEEGDGWVVPGEENNNREDDEDEWGMYDGLDLSDIEYPLKGDQYDANDNFPRPDDGVPQNPIVIEPQPAPAEPEKSPEQQQQPEQQKPDSSDSSESVEQGNNVNDNAAWGALVLHEIDAKQPVRMTPNPHRPPVNEDSQAGGGIDLTSSTALIGLISILAVGTVLMIFACRRYFAGDRAGGPRYTPLRETKVEQPSASTHLVYSSPVPVYRD